VAFSTSARVRPIELRPGARYRCFGDGLCCTDIHALGPLNRSEVVRIRRIEPGSVGQQGGFREPMLRTKPDGSCVFQLSDQRCQVHARFGPAAKPAGCRRFPLGLVATPRGGRVTTDHRCPCRTLGERPLLTEEAVVPSLRDGAGRLEADRRVERVSLTRHRHVPFDTYAQLEAHMLARLAAGEVPEKVLDAKPFPALRGTSWVREARVFLDGHDGTQFGVALSWFADAVLELRCRRPAKARRARPWAAAFERAVARSPVSRTSDEVLADWVADDLWALRFPDEAWSFDRFRVELATRLAIARWITARLRSRGLREDQAAAEAVTIVDMIGASEYWNDVVQWMRV
jgi:hypothetical protein